MKKIIAMGIAACLMAQVTIPMSVKAEEKVPYEKEINDAFLLANSLGKSGIKGSMQILYTDKDYYKVSFPDNGEVSFSLENVPLGRSYSMKVYDRSRKLLETVSTNSKTETVTLDSVKAKSTYYVRVSGNRKLLDKKQYYYLSYLQNNATMEHPTVIEEELTAVNLLSEKSEAWLAFTPESTDSYTFTTVGGGDTYGVLYDSTKENVLMENNDGFDDKGFLLGHTLLAGETYYIKVSANTYTEDQKAFQVKTSKIERPNDDEFYEQWTILNGATGNDVNILPLWQYSKGEGVKVGVLDTGVDYNHFDLAANIDMDLAYNFFHNIKDVFPANEIHNGIGSSARSGHGTRTASVIGAVANNGVGIVGLAPESSIVPIKIMGTALTGEETNQGSVTAFLDSIEYVYNNNIPIANCSFGGEVPSVFEQQAMIKAKDTLFVIAAGNDSYDLSVNPVYPACYYNENAVVVMGCTRDGEPTDYTNYGGPTNIAAPGQSVYCLSPDDWFDYGGGTSIATPFASGVAALLLGQDKALTTQELKDKLIGKNSVDTNQALQGYSTSGGTLNALKAALSSKTTSRAAKTPTRDIFGSEDAVKNAISIIKEQASDDQKTRSIIVKLAAGENIDDILSIIAEENEEISVQEYQYFSFVDAYEIVFETIAEADRAVDIFNGYNTVQYAEPNYVRSVEKQ